MVPRALDDQVYPGHVAVGYKHEVWFSRRLVGALMEVMAVFIKMQTMQNFSDCSRR